MTKLRTHPAFIVSVLFGILVLFSLAAFYYSRIESIFAESSLKNKADSLAEADMVDNNGQKGIVFIGDIMLARSVERSLLTLPKEYAFLGVKQWFKDKSVIGNFEAAIPVVHEPTPNFTFKFSVTPQLLPILSEAGIKYLSLANNHALDYGTAGYKNTFEELEKQGIIPFGQPSTISDSSVVYIKINNKKVAIIGITNLFGNPSETIWWPIFDEAIKNSDLQVVYIHWGNEYESVHSESQMKLAKQFIDAGIDIIVGHHPHVVQDVWRYGDGLVFYSLGNFIFDQYWEDAVLNGLALDLCPEDENSWQVKLVPVESKSVRLQPHEMADKEKETFLASLATHSDPALADDIKKGTISLQF